MNLSHRPGDVALKGLANPSAGQQFAQLRSYRFASRLPVAILAAATTPRSHGRGTRLALCCSQLIALAAYPCAVGSILA